MAAHAVLRSGKYLRIITSSGAKTKCHNDWGRAIISISMPFISTFSSS